MCPYFTLLLVRKSLKHGPFRSQLFPGSQMGRGLVSCKVSEPETSNVYVLRPSPSVYFRGSYADAVSRAI